MEVGGGRIAVYGDSNCLDSSHMVTNCFGLLKKMLDFTSRNIKDPMLFSDSVRQEKPLYVDTNQLPSRRTDVNFSTYSRVVGKELTCSRDSRFEVWGTKGYNLQVRGRNRKLPGYHVIDLGRGLNSTVDTHVFVKSNAAQKDVHSPGNNYWSFFYRDDVSNLWIHFFLKLDSFAFVHAKYFNIFLIFFFIQVFVKYFFKKYS